MDATGCLRQPVQPSVTADHAHLPYNCNYWAVIYASSPRTAIPFFNAQARPFMQARDLRCTLGMLTSCRYTHADIPSTCCCFGNSIQASLTNMLLPAHYLLQRMHLESCSITSVAGGIS